MSLGGSPYLWLSKCQGLQLLEIFFKGDMKATSYYSDFAILTWSSHFYVYPYCILIIFTVFKGYDDGYGGEYDDPSYEAYDNSYAAQTQSVPEYYDYGHGTSEDAYDSYAQEEWATTRSSLKAPPPRSARGGYREHPYGRY
uniref:Sam68 tyrosine-rich domain-containing protein n=1 Tax=Gopherus agassizii TaxID=38772 RepID=A0A452GJU3_9SAUR